MTTEDMEELLATSDRMVGATETAFHRYLATQIDWRDRLVCIEGARGTGKSTLMRQRIKEAFGLGGHAVYVSLDDLWFSNHRVKDAVAWFDSHGYTHLFMDEVHQVENWHALVKNLYDQFPSLNIVYSGSSLLKLGKGKGDLSRRQAVYGLKGLSFREFLAFEGVLDIPPIPFEKVLSDHRKIAAGIVGKIKVLPLFERYLREGYYPFYKEVHALYHARIIEAVNKALEVDWPVVVDVSVSTVRRAKRMLAVLAASVPQQPNMSRLYRELDTERNTGFKILDALARSGLLALLPGKGASLKNLSKPKKIYCDNTNLMYALAPRIDKGTARETFFLNQLSKVHAVSYPSAGDFLVDGKYLFEVGGAGKGFQQIKDLPNSYIASDDTEIGIGHKVPLWMFGLLY